MQYALIDHQPIRAGDIAPGFVVADVGRSLARCLYCGEWVYLNTAKGLAWRHSNPADKVACVTERDEAQAELNEALRCV